MYRMSIPPRLQNRHVGPVSILCAPIIIWALPVLLSGSQSFTGQDMPFYFYPLIKIGMNQWVHGMVPLWTNLIQCGFPLLADGQAALCYPLHLLANLVLPVVLAEHCCVVFQVLLTAIFMYVFLCRIGFDRWSAVVGGWIWVFSGPIPASMQSPALNGMTWWPLWFFLANRFSSNFDWRAVAITCFIMGMGWLGGFPQTTFYGIFAASAYLVFLLILRNRNRWKAYIPVLGGWAIAAVLSMGVAAIQIIPTLEMSGLSVRSGGIDYAFATFGSMPPTGLVGLLIPDWAERLCTYGLTGVNVFMGFIPLSMVIVCFEKRMHKRTLFFIGLIIAGWLMASGKYNPLYKIISALPGFNFFHNPYRFFYWSYFGLAVLSAEGYNRFHAAVQGSSVEIRRMIIRLSGTIGVSLGICAGGILVFRCEKNTIAKIALRQAQSLMINHPYKMQHIDYYSAKINRMIADIAAALNPVNSNYFIAILLACVAIVFLAAGLRRPRLHPLISIALMALSLINITEFWSILHNRPNMNNFKPPQLADYCSKQNGLFRIYNMRSQEDLIHVYYDSYDRLDPNYNMLFNVAQVGAYSALGSYRYFKLLGSLGNVNLAFGTPPVTENAVRNGFPILNLCNVRYVTSTTRLNIPGLTQEPFDSFFLYKNDSMMPRAFVVPKAIIIPDPESLLDALHSTGFDPWAGVFLESAPQTRIVTGIRSTPRISSYDDQHISMEADGPGWLVLTDLFYPGWKSRIDGQETSVYRGDYVFRTLLLPAGRHHVEFYLEAHSFRNGAIISAISVCIMSIIFCFGLFIAEHRMKRLHCLNM
jgi:hypothetical protein